MLPLQMATFLAAFDADTAVGLLLGILLFVIPTCVFARDVSRMLAEEKERSKSPFTEKLLRPPGETLRLKVDELRSEILDRHFSLILLLVLPGFVTMLLSSLTLVWVVPLATLVAAVCFYLAYRKWQAIKLLRTSLQNYRLGFDGERYVGSELNVLMTGGYRVFHDFLVDWLPGGEESNFNIDHIVLGPNGVIAVETKARRKPLEEPKTSAKSAFRVTFTGEALLFPSGFEDRKTIAQAKRNAELLSQWLTGSGASPIPVLPLVVIPGWFVERKGKGAVQVLSGKGVEKYIPAMGRSGELTTEQQLQLADRLEAHCRNVEGA